MKHRVLARSDYLLETNQAGGTKIVVEVSGAELRIADR
jgi:hypothetical protein